MYVIRRIGVFLFSLILASMLVFGVMSILPGDPAIVILGTRATPEAVESLRQELGLDRPIPVQYADWFSDAIRGDLGESVFTGKAIAPQVVDRRLWIVPQRDRSSGFVLRGRQPGLSRLDLERQVVQRSTAHRFPAMQSEMPS